VLTIEKPNLHAEVTRRMCQITDFPKPWLKGHSPRYARACLGAPLTLHLLCITLVITVSMSLNIAEHMDQYISVANHDLL